MNKLIYIAPVHRLTPGCKGIDITLLNEQSSLLAAAQETFKQNTPTWKAIEGILNLTSHLSTLAQED